MATFGKRSHDAASWDAGTTTGLQDLLLLLARVLIGILFVQSGLGKLTNLSGFATSLEGMGVPMPMALGAVGAVVEFLGGVAIVLGAWTWLGALALAGFTVAATLLAHRFWDVPAEQQRMQNIQFMKNVAIIGGLLAVMAAGAGRYSVDRARRRR